MGQYWLPVKPFKFSVEFFIFIANVQLALLLIKEELVEIKPLNARFTIRIPAGISYLRFRQFRDDAKLVRFALNHSIVCNN